MKVSTMIIIIFSLLETGCTTTYLNLKENNKEQIEEKIVELEQNKNEGAEVTLSLQNGKEIIGELLSVRESSITICTEYSITEEELAKLIYPITAVRNDEIKELTLEGGNYIWAGIGYGALGGAALGAISFYFATEGNTHVTQGAGALIGGILGVLAGAIAGGIIGYTSSTDEVILQEIPTDYNWSILKPLSRYPDEEPEYLKAIE